MWTNKSVLCLEVSAIDTVLVPRIVNKRCSNVSNIVLISSKLLQTLKFVCVGTFYNLEQEHDRPQASI